MNIEVLKSLLAVPSYSFKEDQMVAWLVDYIQTRFPTARVVVDTHKNVYVVKGNPEIAPCVAAHLDTVQPMRPVRVVEDAGRLLGFDTQNKQTGIGADDKAGIFVCLNLLERFDNLRAVFFAAEECGCVGARNAEEDFFQSVAYLIEYDCPSRNMLSYTTSGVQLFSNQGCFIREALPVLRKHGTVLWQHHPFTDVTALRRRFPISCLNLSCGYYNWHAKNEFIKIDEVGLAIEQGTDLVNTLERRRYWCPVDLFEDGEPAIAVTGLKVPTP